MRISRYSEGYQDPEIQCDGCNNLFYAKELAKCPSAYDEGEHGETYWKRFCEQCCADIYDSEGCQSDVGNCDRADSLFLKKFHEYMRKVGFEKSSKHDSLYFDKSRIHCIASFDLSPKRAIRGKQSISPVHDFFEGEDSFLCRSKNRVSAYNVEIVNEVKRHLDALGLSDLTYEILDKPRILILNAYAAWGAVTPYSSPSNLFCLEKQKFVEIAVGGARFFDVKSEKDDAIILRPSEIKVDWTKIGSEKFEELCRDLLRRMSGVKEVRIVGGPGEFGRDIELIEKVTNLLGETEQTWVIQCKHFPSRKVKRSDLARSSFDAFIKFNYNVYCVMTSGLVSAGCYDFLKSLEKDERLKVKVKVFDGKDLEDMLRTPPDVYATYFV